MHGENLKFLVHVFVYHIALGEIIIKEDILHYVPVSYI